MCHVVSSEPRTSVCLRGVNRAACPVHHRQIAVMLGCSHGTQFLQQRFISRLYSYYVQNLEICNLHDDSCNGSISLQVIYVFRSPIAILLCLPAAFLPSLSLFLFIISFIFRRTVRQPSNHRRYFIPENKISLIDMKPFPPRSDPLFAGTRSSENGHSLEFYFYALRKRHKLEVA